MWGDIAIAFLLAFITAYVLTPHTMRLAKKVGAIDIPNDRRVNNKPMPRLRRNSSYMWFFSFNIVFAYCNDYRRVYRFIGFKSVWSKAIGICNRNSNFRNYMFY